MHAAVLALAAARPTPSVRMLPLPTRRRIPSGGRAPLGLPWVGPLRVDLLDDVAASPRRAESWSGHDARPNSARGSTCGWPAQAPRRRRRGGVGLGHGIPEARYQARRLHPPLVCRPFRLPSARIVHYTAIYPKLCSSHAVSASPSVRPDRCGGPYLVEVTSATRSSTPDLLVDTAGASRDPRSVG
jgi:hypothetical protein